MEYTIFGLLILVILYLYFRMNDMQSRLKSIDYFISQIATHTEWTEKINHELRLLIAEGKYVEAVKTARVVFNMSLLEAKQYVDRL
ncbi:hypothetical protein [uncultured Brevibacillus sp.]|uniref:hypothetical protein n=1 Tax=uncultured Brevibacillus sp. TaxID=169970 RepID=UPI0025914CD1|nr:hypothetical protein [uncultured Brevibacillus sp.]